MSTILATMNAVTVDASVLAGDMQTSGTELLGNLRSFLMPYVLIAVAATAITFIWRRQTSELLRFLIITAVVLAIVYSPVIIENIGIWLGNTANEAIPTQPRGGGGTPAKTQ